MAERGARKLQKVAWQFLFGRGEVDNVWTLYDPLVRPVQSDAGVGERRRENLRTRATRLPRTVEKVWLLLEPQGLFVRRAPGGDPRGPN